MPCSRFHLGGGDCFAISSFPLLRSGSLGLHLSLMFVCSLMCLFLYCIPCFIIVVFVMESDDLAKLWEPFSLNDKDVFEVNLDSSLQCFGENMVAKIVVLKILSNRPIN